MFLASLTQCTMCVYMRSEHTVFVSCLTFLFKNASSAGWYVYVINTKMNEWKIISSLNHLKKYKLQWWTVIDYDRFFWSMSVSYYSDWHLVLSPSKLRQLPATAQETYSKELLSSSYEVTMVLCCPTSFWHGAIFSYSGDIQHTAARQLPVTAYTDTADSEQMEIMTHFADFDHIVSFSWRSHWLVCSLLFLQLSCYITVWMHFTAFHSDGLFDISVSTMTAAVNQTDTNVQATKFQVIYE